MLIFPVSALFMFMESNDGRLFLLQVRQTLGDFAVFLSICCMVGLDAFLGVPTPKLDVPDKIRVNTLSMF